MMHALLERVTSIQKRYASLGVIGNQDRFGVATKSATAADISATENETGRFISMVVTTDDVDLENEVVDPNGADTTYINTRGQGKVFLDHRMETEFTIGSIVYTAKHVVDGVLRGYRQLIQVRSNSSFPFADDCWNMAKTIGIGASVGYAGRVLTQVYPTDPDRWRGAKSVVRRWKWIETSLTAAPMNVSCQSQAVTEGKRLAQLDELVTKSIIKRETAAIMGLADARPRIIISLASE